MRYITVVCLLLTGALAGAQSASRTKPKDDLVFSRMFYPKSLRENKDLDRNLVSVDRLVVKELRLRQIQYGCAVLYRAGSLGQPIEIYVASKVDSNNLTGVAIVTELRSPYHMKNVARLKLAAQIVDAVIEHCGRGAPYREP